MPTPFTHLQAAERLLNDADVPAPVRDYLRQYHSAFLLGNVAADVRLPSKERADTHFYHYNEAITERLWRVMLERYPALKQALPAAQRAFVAGYVMHLSMDEHWALAMLAPHFVQKDWPDREEAFLMLHVVLTYMDQRDYGLLNAATRTDLLASAPQEWSPFIEDGLLVQWRDFIGKQLPPGQSLTVQIFDERVRAVIPDYSALFVAPKALYTRLWEHIPQAVLHEIEEGMYTFARDQLVAYLEECPVAP
jgi:hypothetical protein